MQVYKLASTPYWVTVNETRYLGGFFKGDPNAKIKINQSQVLLAAKKLPAGFLVWDGKCSFPFAVAPRKMFEVKEKAALTQWKSSVVVYNSNNGGAAEITW